VVVAKVVNGCGGQDRKVGQDRRLVKTRLVKIERLVKTEGWSRQKVGADAKSKSG
jgi:hypothetical protein